MSKAERVLVPLLNPNEIEARLIDLRVKDGQPVKAGEELGTLETTKSTFDLSATRKGFVVALKAKQGELLRAGETFCYLADSADWKAPKEKKEDATLAAGLPEGLRITQPALTIAQSEGLDLSLLPIGPIVTEAQVRKALSKSKKVTAMEIPSEASDEKAIIVYGGGGHGKAVIELIRAIGGYTLVGVVDDALEPASFVMGVPVLGSGESILTPLREGGCQLAINAVGGIGAISSRIQVFERLEEAGFGSPALIHPSAVLEPSAMLSSGAQIFPHAYVGSEARIGAGVIVNTGVIVSHDCELADYVNLAPGAILAGAVSISEGALIGMGVTINLNVRIGQRARIGNGATIKADVPAEGIVRAGTVWPS